MQVLTVPPVRVRAVNEVAPRRGPAGAYVLYWMIAARRTRWSFGLQRALWHCHELGLPLIVLEALRVGYPWASDRLHTFVMQGMADNAARLAEAGIAHYPFIEARPGEGKGLLAALAARAAVVVTDDFPAFFLPRMVEAAGRQLDVRLEQVDGNGIYPLAAADKPLSRAFDLRRRLQRDLRPHLDAFPVPDPLADATGARGGEVPDAVLRRWPAADPDRLSRVADLPIDHTVAPSPLTGGPVAGEAVLRSFLADRLDRYDDARHPDADATSGLSPWLHFGHVSAHEVVAGVLNREKWSPDDLGAKASGAREGWWGVSPQAESFLDQIVTWRELGYIASRHGDQTVYEGLPDWARQSLQDHAGDPRQVYDLKTLTEGRTADPIWNAAQQQLLQEGRIHNYLRMLWGKRLLEWSASPQEAFQRMIALNDRFALDGRDPNSYSGIGWVLGRYDRAWGPERPVFGKIRYMSSDSTRRKLRMSGYLSRFDKPGGASPVS